MNWQQTKQFEITTKEWSGWGYDYEHNDIDTMELVLQEDGNIVLYYEDKAKNLRKKLWATDTRGTDLILWLLADGTLSVRKENGEELWKTRHGLKGGGKGPYKLEMP